MNALLTSPLSPMGLLFGGGALLFWGRRYLSARVQQSLPVAWIILAMLLWLRLRWMPPGAGQWWLWQAPLGLETALGFQWNGWTWIAGWLLFLAALTVVLLPQWKPRSGFFPIQFWILWLLAAALLVVSAATWSTLLIAWALLLFFTGVVAGSPPRSAPLAWTMLAVAGLFLYMAPLFNGFGSFTLLLQAETLNLQAQLLVSLAVMVVVGAYPFHVWMTASASRAPGHQLALHVLPALAALHMLSRFDVPLLSSFSWISFGIAGLLGSAIAAWLSEDEQQVWDFIAINRTTWVMLALALSRDASLYRYLAPLTALGVILIVWGVFRVHASRSHPIFKLLTLAFLLGFPFTPGFVLNIHLAQLATSVLGFPGWILVLLSQTVFVAAFLRSRGVFADGRQDITGNDASPSWRLTWTMALVVAFGIFWGAFPHLLARTVGLAPLDMYANPLAPLRHAGVLTGWMTLLLPLLLGWLLARWHQRLFAGLEAFTHRMAEIARLRWLVRGVETGFHYLAISVGFAADILDGAGQFGWVLFVLLILWLFFR